MKRPVVATMVPVREEREGREREGGRRRRRRRRRGEVGTELRTQILLAYKCQNTCRPKSKHNICISCVQGAIVQSPCIHSV